ncbi:MAG: zf-HC2 domain-containing protein [Nakamurella sp.]
MSDDPFRTWDGPYVLGALSPDDRSSYEIHLRECAACADAVRRLAGLPGLLARADFPDADDLSVPAEAAPDLLPGLLFAARRERRRRRRVSALGWVAAAACAAGLVVALWLPRTPAGTVALTPMTAVAETAIAGQIGVTGVTWGTKIELKCSYPSDESGDERYDLVVFDRAGNSQTVSSWKVVPGRTATMNASTAVAAADIGRLEIQSADGMTVLALPR